MDDKPRARNHYNPSTNKSCRSFRLAIPVGILLVVLLLVLFRFVFVAHNAEITHCSMNLLTSNVNNSSSMVGKSTAGLDRNHSISIQATLGIRNPNLAASFDYYNASFWLELQDEIIDRFNLPSGDIGSQKSKNLTAVLVVVRGTDRDPARSQWKNTKNTTGNHRIPLTIHYSLIGYVHRWAKFRHHFKLGRSCQAFLSLPEESISFHC